MSTEHSIRLYLFHNCVRISFSLLWMEEVNQDWDVGIEEGKVLSKEDAEEKQRYIDYWVESKKAKAHLHHFMKEMDFRDESNLHVEEERERLVHYLLLQDDEPILILYDFNRVVLTYRLFASELSQLEGFRHSYQFLYVSPYEGDGTKFPFLAHVARRTKPSRKGSKKDDANVPEEEEGVEPIVTLLPTYKLLSSFPLQYFKEDYEGGKEGDAPFEWMKSGNSLFASHTKVCLNVLRSNGTLKVGEDFFFTFPSKSSFASGMRGCLSSVEEEEIRFLGGERVKGTHFLKMRC